MSRNTNGKDLVARRRRRRRDSEDEESVTSGAGSDASFVSQPEDGNIEADSVLSDTQSSPATAQSEHKQQKARPERSASSMQETRESAVDEGQAKAPDTNGDAQSQTATNDTAGPETGTPQSLEGVPAPTAATVPAQSKPETLAERRRREQEEYRVKRESDPSFIPNRGNFFMHDPRASDQRGFGTHAGRGRGRDRGGHFGPGGFPHAPHASDSAWTHDLHDSINEGHQRGASNAAMASRAPPFQQRTAAGPRAAPQPEYRPYTFSRSKLLGNVQVRVSLPGMKSPIPFTGVPVNQHTRLPDHRPPLRRDKPVRVSLPDRPPRYIFPSQERSFIFIPRAMRPNQQGYGRSKPGFVPSSRRTSAYGGSAYAPSIAASRRSSIVPDIGREHMFSPTASVSARHMVGGRPVVRLPHGLPPGAGLISPAGSVIYGPPHAFPPPQTPLAEHYRDAAMMHQPRPQKAISVSGIESPAALSMHAPQQRDGQPFENQLPLHGPEGSIGSAQASYAYNGQPINTLSHIPERAIHAQPFQPPAMGAGQGMYGQYGVPGYYYPPVPVFVTQAEQAPPPSRGQDSSRGQAGMMAHETNGMVYYIDPAEMQAPFASQGGYAGAEGYAPAGSYDMGGAIPAAQDGSWYYPANAGTVYYAQGQ